MPDRTSQASSRDLCEDGRKCSLPKAGQHRYSLMPGWTACVGIRTVRVGRSRVSAGSVLLARGLLLRSTPTCCVMDIRGWRAGPGCPGRGIGYTSPWRPGFPRGTCRAHLRGRGSRAWLAGGPPWLADAVVRGVDPPGASCLSWSCLPGHDGTGIPGAGTRTVTMAPDRGCRVVPPLHHVAAG